MVFYDFEDYIYSGNKLKFRVMKAYIFWLLLGCFSLSLSGCSEADDSLNLQQEYLFAEIDGAEFSGDHTNGETTCQKVLTPHGTINLSYKMRRFDGKRIEFLIQNYSGSKRYLIKIPDILNATNSSINWINYVEGPEESSWSTRYNKNLNPEIPDYIEVTEDNGKFLKGHFSFEGHNAEGTSSLSVTNGDFTVMLDY